MLPTILSLILSLSEIKNSEELRFLYSAEQGYDTSCGLTSLSCLLDMYWSIPVDELSLAREYLSERLEGGDFTVSFADMVAILTANGFTSAAYRMSFDQLRAAVLKLAPIMVHYDRPDPHFALVLAIGDNRVIIADPAEGTIARERVDFEAKWSGYVLLAAMPSRKPRGDLIAKAVDSVLGREALLDRSALAMARSLRW